MLFQSTLSVRRATGVDAVAAPIDGISIHALRKESDSVKPWPRQENQRISIHALRKESDLACFSFCFLPWLFQSTLSVRRATRFTVFNYDQIAISIHALRKESDEQGRNVQQLASISIHALRKESDKAMNGIFCKTDNFNPRSP